jgi:TolB-like protein
LAAPKPVEVAGLTAPHRLAGRPSVAVLPFKNLSGDAGQDFFNAGITEDVITALGRFSNLLVVAKSASFQLKDRNLSPAEAPARRSLPARRQRSTCWRSSSRQRRVDRSRDGAKRMVRSV